MIVHSKPSGMQCKKVIKHIQTELDSYINLAAYRQRQEHLRKCTNCKLYLDSLKKVMYLYQRLPILHLNKKSRGRLRKSLYREIHERHTRHQSHFIHTNT